MPLDVMNATGWSEGNKKKHPCRGRRNSNSLEESVQIGEERAESDDIQCVPAVKKAEALGEASSSHLFCAKLLTLLCTLLNHPPFERGQEAWETMQKTHPRIRRCVN
jgi:hypothetical protein